MEVVYNSEDFFIEGEIISFKDEIIKKYLESVIFKYPYELKSEVKTDNEFIRYYNVDIPYEEYSEILTSHIKLDNKSL